MNLASINWAKVYNTLNINTSRKSSLWMLMAILVVGAFMVAAALLTFPHQPEIGLFLSLVMIPIAVWFYYSAIKLNMRPRVVVGSVVSRGVDGFRKSIPLFRSTCHFISIDAIDAFEIDSFGKADYLPLSNRPKRFVCNREIFQNVEEGERVVAVILPYSNSIIQILKTNTY